jgi:small subunit ribosomal protein S9
MAAESAKSVRSTDVLATGRRKIKVNGRDLEAYFPAIKDRVLVSGTLEQVGKQSAVNIDITVDGGGPTGQAGACRLGIARALKAFDGELAENLRHSGMLTRDGRMKERKKYGLRGARRGTQFSKR